MGDRGPTSSRTMGYCLNALIAPRVIFDARVSNIAAARIVRLAQGMSMIPVTDLLYDEIGDGGALGYFAKLSPGIEQWALSLSARGLISYVEAEFFGGVGRQSALVWRDGKRMLGPLHATDAIDQALRLLGVSATADSDEFDALGLGAHRETDEWLAHAVV